MENRESRISTSFEVRSEDDGVAVVEGYAAGYYYDDIAADPAEGPAGASRSDNE